MTLPPYPGSDLEAGTQPRRRARSGPSRWLTIAGIAAALALLVLMIVLHVTGVLGPGEH